MKELREKIKDILVNFAVHTNKCHKKQVEPNLNPWADLFEQLLLEREREVIESFRIKDNEEIDCPLEVCCKNCYRSTIEDRIETLKKEQE